MASHQHNKMTFKALLQQCGYAGQRDNSHPGQDKVECHKIHHAT